MTTKETLTCEPSSHQSRSVVRATTRTVVCADSWSGSTVARMPRVVANAVLEWLRLHGGNPLRISTLEGVEACDWRCAMANVGDRIEVAAGKGAPSKRGTVVATSG